MAKNTATKHCLFTKALCFLVLLICLWCTMVDAASLCYSFTVGKSGSGSWWNKVQGQVNKETFLSYNSTNKCHAISLLGNRLNATKICEKQVDTLKDGVDLFKEQVMHMKQENNTIREPLTLQARMCCWHDVDGHFNGSWDIDLNGHKMLHVDSSTGKWTEGDPGSSWMKEMWEKDGDITAFLKMTSQGDCRAWLEEFRLHWEEKLEPRASRTTIPDVDKSLSKASKPNNSVLLIILTCLLLLLI